MPPTPEDHLKAAHNKFRLILLSKSKLDEDDCIQALLHYGTIRNIDLTSDRRAAFVDFECEHAPLLVARCLGLHKKNPDVPMPKEVDTLLPGCSINNFLYLQHIPRTVSTIAINRCLNLPKGSVIYRPGTVQEPSSRAVIRLFDKNANFYTQNCMRMFRVKYQGTTFYTIPHIPQLSDYSKVCEVAHCNECNVGILREKIVSEERNGETEATGRATAQVPAPPPPAVSAYNPTRGFDFASIDDESEKERWGLIQKKKEVPALPSLQPPPLPQLQQPRPVSPQKESKKVSHRSPSEERRHLERKYKRWFTLPGEGEEYSIESPLSSPSPSPRLPSLLSLSIHPPPQLPETTRREEKKEHPVEKIQLARRDLPPFSTRRDEDEKKANIPFACSDPAPSHIQKVGDDTKDNQIANVPLARPGPPPFSPFSVRADRMDKKEAEQFTRPVQRGVRLVASEAGASAKEAPENEKRKRETPSPESWLWEKEGIPRGFAREAAAREKRETPSPRMGEKGEVPRGLRSATMEGSEKEKRPSPISWLWDDGEVPRGFAREAREAAEKEKRERETPSPRVRLWENGGAPRGFRSSAIAARATAREASESERETPTPSRIEWAIEEEEETVNDAVDEVIVEGLGSIVEEREEVVAEESGSGKRLENGGEREQEPQAELIKSGEMKQEPLAALDTTKEAPVDASDVIVEESGRRVEGEEDVLVEGLDDAKKETKPVTASDVIVEDVVNDGKEESRERVDSVSTDATPLLSGDEDDGREHSLVSSDDEKKEELDSDDLLSGEEDQWRSVGAFPRLSRVGDAVKKEEAVETKEERRYEAGDAPSLLEKDPGRGAFDGRREEEMRGAAPSPSISLAHDDTISSRDLLDGTVEYDTVSEAGTIFDDRAGTVAGGGGASDFEDAATLRCSTPIVRVDGRRSEEKREVAQRGDVLSSSTPVRRWSRTSVVDQEEEDDYRSSEYLEWLTREDGTAKASCVASPGSEPEFVPLPSSFPVTTWGKGIDIVKKTTVPQEKKSRPVVPDLSPPRMNVFGRVPPTFGGKNTRVTPNN